jgi:hypothetical protein
VNTHYHRDVSQTPFGILKPRVTLGLWLFGLVVPTLRKEREGWGTLRRVGAGEFKNNKGEPPASPPS